MLDVERNEDSWMNAVIITGLSDDEKDALDSSEENYDTKELDLESVEPYLEEHSEELEVAFEEGEVQIYIGDAKTTDRFRNQTYHDRIHTGIDLIGELHGEKYEGDLSEEMWQDFIETTVENSTPGKHREEPHSDHGAYVPKIVEDAWREDSKKWENTVSQNDQARENFGRLMEDLWD